MLTKTCVLTVSFPSEKLPAHGCGRFKSVWKAKRYEDDAEAVHRVPARKAPGSTVWPHGFALSWQQ